MSNVTRVSMSSTGWRFINILFRMTFGILFWALKLVHRILAADMSPKGVQSVISPKTKAIKRKFENRPSLIHLWTPWHLSLDTERKIITFKKRAWYLLNSEIHEIKYVNVRNIYIQKYIFTADIQIRVYGGFVTAYYFTRWQADHFKKILFSEVEFTESYA